MNSAYEPIYPTNRPVSTKASYASRAFGWIMTNTTFLLASGLFILALSFIASLLSGQWHWFQRSGATIVSIGAILSTRRILRIALDGKLQQKSYLNGFRIKDEQREGIQEQDSEDLVACLIGFWVVAFGTFVWAYGDLLQCLIELSSICLR